MESYKQKSDFEGCLKTVDSKVVSELRHAAYAGKEENEGGHGDLMVSALVLGLSGPEPSPGRGHCVVFLGKTLYYHSDSLHPGV